MPIEDLRQDDQPFDRLTELANTMRESINTPDNNDVRGIVFLSDSEMSGIVLFGFDDPIRAMAELLVHMKAVFAAQGKGFGVMSDQGFMLIPED